MGIIGALITAGCLSLFGLSRFYNTQILDAYKVPSKSMMPTLLTGDYFYADMSIKSLEDIKRGDIIVYTFPKNPALD